MYSTVRVGTEVIGGGDTGDDLVDGGMLDEVAVQVAVFFVPANTYQACLLSVANQKNKNLLASS